MDRRTFFTAAGATVAALSTGAAVAHPGHDHPAPSPLLATIVNTANHCAHTGEACIAHCMALLASGDTSMADCNRSVHNMTAVCRAMAAVASYATAPVAEIKALAAACAQFCRNCAAACEKHSGHHEVCKQCMESCLACAKACEAFARGA